MDITIVTIIIAITLSYEARIGGLRPKFVAKLQFHKGIAIIATNMAVDVIYNVYIYFLRFYLG